MLKKVILFCIPLLQSICKRRFLDVNKMFILVSNRKKSKKVVDSGPHFVVVYCQLLVVKNILIKQ